MIVGNPLKLRHNASNIRCIDMNVRGPPTAIPQAVPGLLARRMTPLPQAQAGYL